MTSIPFSSELLPEICPHLTPKPSFRRKGVSKLASSPLSRNWIPLAERSSSYTSAPSERPHFCVPVHGSSTVFVHPTDSVYIDALLNQHNYLTSESHVDFRVVGSGRRRLCLTGPCLRHVVKAALTMSSVCRATMPRLVHTVALTQPGDAQDLMDEDVPALLMWQRAATRGYES